MVGGYGSGARAIQARAERKCACISFGMGDVGNGVAVFYEQLVNMMIRPERTRWTYRAISAFPRFTDASDSSTLPSHALPKHISHRPTPFRTIFKTLDGIHIHSCQQVHVSKQLHQPPTRQTCEWRRGIPLC